MAREPFVWEVQIRREILEEEFEQLRDLPYSLWREMIGSPMSKTVVGRDSRNYLVRIEADWDRPGTSDVRVTMSLKLVRWRPTRPVRQSFVITENGRILT